MAISIPSTQTVLQTQPHHPGSAARLWKIARTKKLGAFGFLLVLLLILSAVFGPMLTPYSENQAFLIPNPNYNPRSLDLKALSATKPAILINPSRAHPLGTDQIGRDLLTRVLYGARLSLTVGIASAAIGVLVGTALGVLTGYLGGWVDLVIQRLVDAAIAMPQLILLLLFVQAAPGSEKATILALGVLGIWSTARIIRSATLVVRSEVYVQAALATGAGVWRIMLRHVAPNVIGLIIVSFSVVIGANILAEAGLAFLNLGVHGPSWGKLVADSRAFLDTKPKPSIAGGLAITSAVLGFNLLGDALRDIFDPRQRGAS